MKLVRSFQRPARVSRSLIEQLLRQRQDEGQRRHRHRPAHAVGLVGQQHAVLGAGRHVDRIVADAMPREDARAHGAVAEAGAGHARRIDVDGVVARQFAGVMFVDAFGDELPGDARLAVQHAQRLAPKGRVAGAIQQVAGQPDDEFVHVLSPSYPAVRGSLRAYGLERPRRQRTARSNACPARMPSCGMPWRNSRAPIFRRGHEAGGLAVLVGGRDDARPPPPDSRGAELAGDAHEVGQVEMARATPRRCHRPPRSRRPSRRPRRSRSGDHQRARVGGARSCRPTAPGS